MDAEMHSKNYRNNGNDDIKNKQMLINIKETNQDNYM